MSQSPVSPHFSSASPPYSHGKAISLPLPSPCYRTQLLSSPITPPAPHRWRLSFPSLPDQHTFVLRSLRQQASRHRPAELNLLRDIASVGNAPYLNQRHVIVQWMIDVATTFHFLSTTLHLAVHHVDTFMATRFLSRDLWQLVALSAIFIAAKCEEPHTQIPSLDDLKFICDNAFEHSHICQMEVCMLRALDWDLVIKTPVHFCNHFLTTIRELHNKTNTVDGLPLSLNREEQRPHQGATATDTQPSERHAQADRALHADLENIDAESSDEEDDNYSYISSPTSDMCTCEEPLEYCACSPDDVGSERAGQQPEHLESVSEPAPLQQQMNTARSTSPVSAPEETGVQVVNSEQIQLDTRQPFRSIARVATCFLDVSLHDVSLKGRYTPDVLGAAALELAASEASVPSILNSITPDLIAHVADVRKEIMLECRARLWKAFVETQN